MTTTLLYPDSAQFIDDSGHLIDDYLTSTYVATIDAGIEAASVALRVIDPMSSLAKRLSALGVDDRAVWVESPEGDRPDRCGRRV